MYRGTVRPNPCVGPKRFTEKKERRRVIRIGSKDDDEDDDNGKTYEEE